MNNLLEKFISYSNMNIKQVTVTLNVTDIALYG